MKNAMLALIIVSLMAGVSYAQDSTDKIEVKGEEELVQTKGVFAGTWIHPGADISKYSKLYLWNAYFQFREGGDKSVTSTEMARGDTGPFEIRKEDQDRFKKVVGNAMATELGRSKQFEVADEVGPGTLLVRGAVLDITWNVPPNAGSFSDVHLAAIGDASFVFELIDAETGVIMARGGERRRIQPPNTMWEVNTAPANANVVWSDVERWARGVAQELRKALDKAKKKADK